MTKRQAIKLLKTEKVIDCLDQKSYLMLLALKIQLGYTDHPLAVLNKPKEGK